MSRPYRIVVTKVVEQEVKAADHSVLTLKLDEPVGPERTGELLAAALERGGWRAGEPGQFVKEGSGGETMVCDVEARTVTTRIEIGRTLSEQRRREIKGDTWNWQAMREKTPEEMAEIRRREEDKLGDAVSEQRVRQAERDLARTAAERLAGGEEARRREVNRLAIEVTAAALQEKARELGNVRSVDEAWHGEEYELTIAISE
jgi:hypothetical protein